MTGARLGLLGMVALSVATAAFGQQPKQNGFQQDFSWSPDSRQLVFSNFEDGDADLWIVDVDGTHLRRLTSGAGNDLWTSWSPDGEWILFSSNRDGQAELYKIGPDGRNLTRLTNDPARDFAPAWSPDGRRIMFNRRTQDHVFVEIMSCDGQALATIADDGREYLHPNWSPDGRQIVAYSQEKDQPDRIFIIDAETGNARQVAEEAHAFYPTWTADGTGIVYTQIIGDEKLIVSRQLSEEGQAAVLTRGLGYFGRMSPNGRQIAWIETLAIGYPVPSRIMVAAADGTGGRAIFDGQEAQLSAALDTEGGGR